MCSATIIWSARTGIILHPRRNACVCKSRVIILPVLLVGGLVCVRNSSCVPSVVYRNGTFADIKIAFSSTIDVCFSYKLEMLKCCKLLRLPLADIRDFRSRELHVSSQRMRQSKALKSRVKIWKVIYIIINDNIVIFKSV